MLLRNIVEDCWFDLPCQTGGYASPGIRLVSHGRACCMYSLNHRRRRWWDGRRCLSTPAIGHVLLCLSLKQFLCVCHSGRGFNGFHIVENSSSDHGAGNERRSFVSQDLAPTGEEADCFPSLSFLEDVIFFFFTVNPWSLMGKMTKVFRWFRKIEFITVKLAMNCFAYFRCSSDMTSPVMRAASSTTAWKKLEAIEKIKRVGGSNPNSRELWSNLIQWLGDNREQEALTFFVLREHIKFSTYIGRQLSWAIPRRAFHLKLRN